MDEFNPYARPKLRYCRRTELTGIPTKLGAIRLLIARKGAVLPDRCLKCNAPRTGINSLAA